MLQEPMRPREYRQLPSRTPDPKTPVDNWAADDWLSQGVWGLEDASDDDGTMPPIGFRLSGRMRRLADQIRTDPNSPYFNLFKTPTDLWRHLVVKGLIALGEAPESSYRLLHPCDRPGRSCRDFVVLPVLRFL